MFSDDASAEPGEVIYRDRFSQTETAVSYRRAECYHCDFVGIYRVQVRQVRRHPEILLSEGEEIRSDHEEIWRAVPRFAEIPQTVCCKRCGEVMGFYTSCIF